MDPSGNIIPEGQDMIHLAKDAEKNAVKKQDPSKLPEPSQTSTPVGVVTQSQTSVGVPKKCIYVVPMPHQSRLKEPQIQTQTPAADATQTLTPVVSTKHIFIVTQLLSAGDSTQTQAPGTMKHVNVLAQPQNAAGKTDSLKVLGQSQITTPTGATAQSQITACVKAQTQSAAGTTDPLNVPRQAMEMVQFQPQPSTERDAAPTKADAQSQTPTVVADVVSILQHGDVRPAPKPYLVHKEEVLRRMDAPEKMSVRTLLMYTGKNPADLDSKNQLVKNLIKVGIPPIETPAYITSAFTRLTEGDVTMLCSDMKSLATEHLNVPNMAKQLIQETNPVQHWSKIIDTKAQLEEMRLGFRDPANSRLMDNVTHGMSTGVMDATFEILSTLIDYQVQLLACLINTKPSRQTPTRTAVKSRPPKALQTTVSLVNPPVTTNLTQTQPLLCCQETENETQTDTQLPKKPLKQHKGRGLQRGPRGPYRKRVASVSSDRKQEQEATQGKGRGKKIKLNPSPQVAMDTQE